MKLIADSGSTKTDWALVDGKELVETLHTQGINPIHQSENDVRTILRNELLPQLAGREVQEIHFYGSGVRPTEEALMQRLLQEATGAQQVEAKSDLLGAARGLCNYSEGIVCILGTGANSGYYDGKRIVMNTPPLGYILGDEGSGAVLGIRLLNGLYKGLLPHELREEFESEYDLSLTEVINQVYRQPMPNRFLASLSPFVHRHLHVPAISELVISNFQDFIHRNIIPYEKPNIPLCAVGSIAFCYHEQLQKAAYREHLIFARVEKSPLQPLVYFHS